MSSKELSGDLVITLVKKARRSLSSGTENSNQPDLQSNDPITTTDETEDSNNISGQCARTNNISLSRPPSYKTIVSDSELPTPKITLAAERGDIQQSPTPPSLGQESEVTETRTLDLATSYFPPISPDSALPPLPKPVLIPRVNPGAQIPFARAWAPELANHGITREDLITFIDNLNIIIRPHVAIRMVRIVALAVGFIPYEGADGVASALEAMTMLATSAMSYKRSKTYLGLMNEKYFHPRKLHVKIISTKRMMKMFGLDKKDPLVAPLNEGTLDLSVQERCLRHLSKWACELSLDDIPPPSSQTNKLARIAAWEVRHKISKADRKAKRSRKRAWKKHLKGKDFKEGRAEKTRIKRLDWILIQNLDEWEAAKAEKQTRKEGKKRSSSWRVGY
ncbi:hypothetical protein F4677DRAFT_407496 [Hypoxylon crocopeplum]|nr:hypothetical protein F4677DRAFT_407496 [Hypoxylon crocopeplum]